MGRRALELTQDRAARSARRCHPAVLCSVTSRSDLSVASGPMRNAAPIALVVFSTMVTQAALQATVTQ